MPGSMLHGKDRKAWILLDVKDDHLARDGDQGDLEHDLYMDDVFNQVSPDRL